MAEQKFYDMADTAENIDSVIHDLVEVVTEENDGKVLMVEKVVDEETEEVSVNIVEADLPVLEGNENEIVVFDGENWGKQSGVYSYETDKTFFDYYSQYRHFKIWNIHNSSGIDLTGVKIIDVTDNEEFIVYDMQTDANFSSISKTKTSITPLYIGSSSEYTLNVTPVNSITIETLADPYDRYNNLTRYVGIDMSQFSILSRKYRIEIETFSGSTVYLSLISPYDQTGIPLAGTVDQGSGVRTIKYTPSDITKTIKTLHSTCSEFSIEGGGLFSISHGSRLTMHGGVADITNDSELYLHDKAKIHADSGAQLLLHDGSWVTADGESRMHLHDKSILTIGDCARVHIQGNSNKGADGKGARVILNGDSRFYMQSVGADSPEMALNGGSKFYMNSDDSGSPDVAFNGDCKFFMNGNNNAPDEVRLTWSDPIIVANKTQLMYCGSHSNIDDMGTPDNPTPYPFLSLDRAKVMIGGPKYDDLDPTHGSTFWSSYPNFNGFKISGSYASDIVITSLIVTDITDANNLEIIYNMQEDAEFENISTSSSPLFTSGTFTISTSPNIITFPAVASQTLGNSRFLGIRKNLFDISRRYKINIICTPTTGTRSLSYIRSDGEVFATYLIGGASDINYTMPEKDIGSSTWIKIGTEEGNVQVHVLNNSFLQLSGNAHSEMHNDSFFIMKNRPENSVLETKAKNLYMLETGLLWANLTEEEKLPWYKKADNGHEKVEGSPFFQMVNNSSIDLDDGIDITGDSSGLYLNDEKIATEYSYETEEEGETILNTVNIETLFTELQSALARIAELEETIQTLNP